MDSRFFNPEESSLFLPWRHVYILNIIPVVFIKGAFFSWPVPWLTYRPLTALCWNNFTCQILMLEVRIVTQKTCACSSSPAIPGVDNTSLMIFRSTFLLAARPPASLVLIPRVTVTSLSHCLNGLHRNLFPLPKLFFPFCHVSWNVRNIFKKCLPLHNFPHPTLFYIEFFSQPGFFCDLSKSFLCS